MSRFRNIIEGCFQTPDRGRWEPRSSPSCCSQQSGPWSGSFCPSSYREDPTRVSFRYRPPILVRMCSSDWPVAGCPDDHWCLLLALLALLLHESDEPSDRSRPGDQGSLRHEEPVGRRRRLNILYHSYNIPIVFVWMVIVQKHTCVM